MGVVDYQPSVDDLARLIPSRATGRFTGGADPDPQFPDVDRVEAIITSATALVAAQLGGNMLAEHFNDAAKMLVMLKAALLLEPAAWPEQARPDKSAWEQWKAQYDSDLAGVIEAVKRDRDDGEDGEGGPGITQPPVAAFPPSGLTRPCPQEW